MAITTIQPATRTPERELADMLVEVLHLDIPAGDIDPEAPLYGDQGLGLDSIDILEIAMAISKTYGIRLRSDDENNARIFSSLRSLNEHIRKLQTR